MDGRYNITYNEQSVNINFVTGCNIINHNKGLYACTISLNNYI